jgi:uncharacterized protein (TIGR03083 family)
MTTTPQPLTGFDPLAEISEHSAALARAAENNLAAQVEHCPGWTVADLVWHLIEVHWFWSTVVAELLVAPPSEEQAPQRPAADELIPTLLTGATHLVTVLSAADQSAGCWTWAPADQNVAFVTRHQVQEAAVHRWDAEHAAGRDVDLGTAMSVDAIDEFLTFSVPTMADHPETPKPSLDGALMLAASDAAANWKITDGALPGTIEVSRAQADPELPSVTGTASELLLWLYQRIQLPVSAGNSADQHAAADLASRFQALTFTD